MPTFAVYTNRRKDEIPDDFLKDATDYIAKVLGKPASYVCVRVHSDQMMSFGGSTEPCGSVDLYSIGAIGKERNDELTKDIGNYINTKLDIPKDRFYITFFDLERYNVGHNGKTFAK